MKGSYGMVLKENDLLYLNNKEGVYLTTLQTAFKIRKFVKTTDDTNTYEVTKESLDGTKEFGLLKEFDPQFFSEDAFERSENKLIYAGHGEQVQDFFQAKGKFEKSFFDLISLQKAHLGELISSYLPDIQVYEAVSNDLEKNGTAYIWIPHRLDGKILSDYLVDKMDQIKADQQLKYVAEVFEIFKELSECIGALHHFNLLHAGLTLNDLLVSFDKNQKCHLRLYDTEAINAKANEEYSAPEVIANDSFDQRADIYTIGAMIYNSLFEFSGAYPLEKEDTSINEKIVSSKLIGSRFDQPLNDLQAQIKTILEKTLSKDVENRYESCEDLTFAFDEAISVTKGAIYHFDQRMIEKMNYRNMMSNLLFKEPIYKYIETNRKMRILVIGQSEASFEFINVALQAGQSYDTEFELKVLSDDAKTYKDSYLEGKPALEEFVQIQLAGEITNKDKVVDPAYAAINFEEAPSLEAEQIFDYIDTDYIFIGTNEDAMNIELAEKIHDFNPNSFVAFVKNSSLPYESKSKKIYTIDLSDESIGKIDPQLEKIAFNLHLTWEMESSHRIDMIKSRADFEKTYNKASSIASALSILYKLNSVGIQLYADELEHLDQETMDAIKKVVASGTATFKQLVYLEHRRWVLAQAVDGWQSFEKTKKPSIYKRKVYIQFIKAGNVKDEENKLHGCMLTSTDDMPLTNLEDWDNKNLTLDPLDMLSKRMYDYTLELLKEDDLGETIEEKIDKIKADLSTQIVSDGKIENKLDALFYCIERVMNEKRGQTNFTDQLGSYYDDFTDALDNGSVDPQRRKEIDHALEKLKEYTNLYVLRNRPKNYKNLDIAIIKNIPFILKYIPRPVLVMALNLGDNSAPVASDIYKNVASATLIQPSEIHYFAYYEGIIDIEKFVTKYQRIKNYLELIHIPQEKVFLTVAYDQKNESVQKQLTKAQKNKIIFEDHVTSLITDCTPDTFKNVVLENLKTLQNEKDYVMYDMSTSLFASNKFERTLLDDIEKEHISNFEYNAKIQKFFNMNNCDYLNYNIYQPALKIDDMLAINGQERKSYHEPGLDAEYEKLWNIYITNSGREEDYSDANYRESVDNWTNLTSKVKESSEEQDVLSICKERELQKQNINKKLSIERNENVKRNRYKCRVDSQKMKLFKPIIKELEKLNLISNLKRVEGDQNFYQTFTFKACQSSVKKTINKKEIKVDTIEEIIKNICTGYQKNKGDNDQQFVKGKEEVDHFYRDADFSSDKFNSEIIVEDWTKSYQLHYDHKGVTLDFSKPLKRGKIVSKAKSDKVLDALANKGAIECYNARSKEYFNFYDDSNDANNSNNSSNQAKSGKSNNSDKHDNIEYFEFKSKPFKDILTKEGEILEVYTYYKAKETNYFDDIAQGIEFGLKDSNVFNEMDCILTKGQRMMFVECKATQKLKQDYFYKLKCIADHYGIEPIPVLVSNQYLQSDKNFAGGQATNKMQMERGNDLDVITISDPDELKDIGNVLVSIMEGTYNKA